jgi:hypothetical protein
MGFSGVPLAGDSCPELQCDDCNRRRKERRSLRVR